MIPKSALIDTCVLVAAFDRTHPDHKEARRVLDLLERRKVDAWISALIWAQLGRGAGGTARAGTLHPLAFDRECGAALATHLPTQAMKDAFGARGERDRWDFDAMIYATAIANKLDAVVTFNVRDFKRLRQACVGVGRFPDPLGPSDIAEAKQHDLFAQ